MITFSQLKIGSILWSQNGFALVQNRVTKLEFDTDYLIKTQVGDTYSTDYLKKTNEILSLETIKNSTVVKFNNRTMYCNQSDARGALKIAIVNRIAEYRKAIDEELAKLERDFKLLTEY